MLQIGSRVRYWRRFFFQLFLYKFLRNENDNPNPPMMNALGPKSSSEYPQRGSVMYNHQQNNQTSTSGSISEHLLFCHSGISVIFSSHNPLFCRSHIIPNILTWGCWFLAEQHKLRSHQVFHFSVVFNPWLLTSGFQSLIQDTSFPSALRWATFGMVGAVVLDWQVD